MCTCSLHAVGDKGAGSERIGVSTLATNTPASSALIRVSRCLVIDLGVGWLVLTIIVVVAFRNQFTQG